MLLVCGAGSAEHAHTFDSSRTLQDFLRLYTAMLVRDGWTLEIIPDRRSRMPNKREFPAGTDRRRCDPSVLWL